MKSNCDSQSLGFLCPFQKSHQGAIYGELTDPVAPATAPARTSRSGTYVCQVSAQTLDVRFMQISFKLQRQRQRQPKSCYINFPS